MAVERNRNRGNQTVTENEAPIVAPQDVTPTLEPTDAANQDTATDETVKAKRAARPPIDVGTVIVRKSTRDPKDLTTRPSRITADPIYLAVQGADFDEATDIVAHKDKVEAVNKRLRGVSDPKHLNVSMHIVPGNPQAYEVDEAGNQGAEIPNHVLVTFVKGKERQTREKKPVEAAASPTAETPAAE